MYETMIAAPTMYVEPVRSEFLYKFNKVDPEKGKELDEKLRTIQCELVVNIATHGFATEETLKIYNTISKARSYENLQKIHPLSSGLGVAKDVVGAAGTSGSVTISTSPKRLASSSSMSASDMCEFISVSK